MKWNQRIRQLHRWLSIFFTLAVIANFAAMTQGPPPAWITYSPLPPLALMLLSGLYLFMLPYVARAPQPGQSGHPLLAPASEKLP